MGAAKPTVGGQKIGDRTDIGTEPAGIAHRTGTIRRCVSHGRGNQGESAVRPRCKIGQDRFPRFETAGCYDRIARVAETVFHFMQIELRRTEIHIDFPHVAGENPIVFPVGTEHFREGGPREDVRQTAGDCGGQHIAFARITDAARHGFGAFQKRHGRPAVFPGDAGESDREGIQFLPFDPFPDLQRCIQRAFELFIGHALIPYETVAVQSEFGIDLGAGRFGLWGVADDLHPERAVRNAEIAHAVEISADLADASVCDTPCHAGAAELLCRAVQHVGMFPMSGGDQERFAVTEQQIAEILYAVDAMIGHDMFRRNELKFRRGVDDDQRQRGRGQRADAFQRRRISQMQCGDRFAAGSFKTFHSLGEFTVQPTGGTLLHLESASLQSRGDPVGESTYPGPDFRDDFVVEREIKRQKSDFHD